MNTRKILALIAICISLTANAAPHVHVHHVPRPGPFRPVHVHHVHHHASFFWPAFAGSLVGHAVVEALKPPVAPTVVSIQTVQPTTIVQSTLPPKLVWVEGHYENRVLANGAVVRTWIPGTWITIP